MIYKTAGKTIAYLRDYLPITSQVAEKSVELPNGLAARPNEVIAAVRISADARKSPVAGEAVAEEVAVIGGYSLPTRKRF